MYIPIHNPDIKGEDNETEKRQDSRIRHGDRFPLNYKVSDVIRT